MAKNTKKQKHKNIRRDLRIKQKVERQKNENKSYRNIIRIVKMFNAYDLFMRLPEKKREFLKNTV